MFQERTPEHLVLSKCPEKATCTRSVIAKLYSGTENHTSTSILSLCWYFSLVHQKQQAISQNQGWAIQIEHRCTCTQTCRHTHTHTYTGTCMHTHACAHARTHARARAHIFQTKNAAEGQISLCGFRNLGHFVMIISGKELFPFIAFGTFCHSIKFVGVRYWYWYTVQQQFILWLITIGYTSHLWLLSKIEGVMFVFLKTKDSRTL